MSHQLLWPEVARTVHTIPCDTCDLKGHSRLVFGEGDPKARAWILLDNPGAREDAQGHAFRCGTRQTLYEALTRRGWGPSTVYVTFVVRRRPRRAYEKESERRRCMGNFWEQWRAIHPALLMCLGDVAVKSVTGDPKASVKGRRQTWWMLGDTRVTASYHPLAVRRRPPLLALFDQDWEMWSREHESRGLAPREVEGRDGCF